MSVAAVLGGCGFFGGGDRATYDEASGTRPLELPPDLVRPVADSRMAIPDLREERVSALDTARPAWEVSSSDVSHETTSKPAEGVLPEYPGMRVRHEGAVRWLEVDADPAVLWPELDDFWRRADIELAREDAQLGIIQTEWIQPAGNFGLRDRYRLRLERQNASTTNVFITHRGVVRSSGIEAQQWEARPSDPELEAEYLTRLMVYLGEPARSAERQIAATNEGATMRLDRVAGIPVLVVEGRFGHVWALTGAALDRAGLPVEAEDVGSGTYYFRYQPAAIPIAGVLTELPDGEGFARLDANGRYQVHLLDQPGQTLITAQSATRQALPPAAAEEILTRLIASMQGRIEAAAQVRTISARTPDDA